MTRQEALNSAEAASQEYHIIRDFILSHGYSPTLDEIMAIGHFSSKKTVCRHVKKLQGLGLITGEIGKPRTLSLVGYSYVDTDDGSIRYGVKNPGQE